MRYAQIRNMDVSNGDGIGVALFVQGCQFHCKNCFNSETWGFNNGKEWTKEIKDKFLKLIDKSYIKRVSILGGSPLVDENIEDIIKLVKDIKRLYPDKKIWLYTGYTFETIMNQVVTDDFNPLRTHYINCRREVLNYIDILVDGQYVDELRDLSLKFRGSSNQRLIDVKKSLEKNEVVLWSK